MKLALLLLLASISAFSQSVFPLSGICEQGGNGVAVNTSIISTGLVQGSYPSCTVTVYSSGTTTLASIYNSTGTPVSNPLTASVAGTWTFYASTGFYDVLLSGGTNGGIPAPYTTTYMVGNTGFGTPPSGASNPATCLVGQLFFNTSQTAGQNLYGCTSTNTWSQLAGGTGVTSVSLNMPTSLFTGCNITITSSGTFTCNYATGQTANENKVLLTNASGAVGFASLTTAMIPTLAYLTSFNTRTGPAITLTSSDVTTALGFTPGNVYTSGTNTYLSGSINDFSASSILKVPVGNTGPTANGGIAFDTTYNQYAVGVQTYQYALLQTALGNTLTSGDCLEGSTGPGGYPEVISTGSPCGSGGGVTWPTIGDIVVSNGSSPSGLYPVNGDCVVGGIGGWTVAACPGGSSYTATAPVTLVSNSFGLGYGTVGGLGTVGGGADIETSVVPCLTCANAYTGNNDFTAGAAVKPLTKGSTAPPCASASTDTGNFWLNTTSSTANHLEVCATVSGTLGWQTIF